MPYEQPNGENINKSSSNNDSKIGDNTGIDNLTNKNAFKSFMLSGFDSKPKPINLNLSSRESKSIAAGAGVGAVIGNISGKKNVKEAKANLEESSIVANKANELCVGNSCPHGSSNPKDYFQRANMDLGVGGIQGRPGYFNSEDFVTPESHAANEKSLKKAKTKRAVKTGVGTLLGGAAGYGVNKLIESRENPNSKLKFRIGG